MSLYTHRPLGSPPSNLWGSSSAPCRRENSEAALKGGSQPPPPQNRRPVGNRVITKAVGEANGENHDRGLEVRRISDVVYAFWAESRRQEDLTETPPAADAGSPSPDLRDHCSLCADVTRTFQGPMNDYLSGGGRSFSFTASGILNLERLLHLYIFFKKKFELAFGKQKCNFV